MLKYRENSSLVPNESIKWWSIEVPVQMQVMHALFCGMMIFFLNLIQVWYADLFIAFYTLQVGGQVVYSGHVHDIASTVI